MNPLLSLALRPLSLAPAIPTVTVPTKPPEDLLDRDWSRAKVGEHIEVAVPLLQEVVNHGVAALSRCLPAIRDEEHHLAVLMPYKHILGMVDAVQILVEAAASAPAQLQLRSAFESLLTIEYILKAETVSRSYSWLAAQAQREIVKLWALRAKHPELDPTPERTDEQLRALQRRLERPGWKEANDQLLEAAQRRMGKKNHFRPVEWFTVAGGPTNLADLAARLGRAKEYNALYRQWSGVTHGQDLEDNLIKGAGKEVVVRRLRLPTDFANVVVFAVTFTYEATCHVLRVYRPGEEFALDAWYKREVQGPLRRF